MSTLQISQGADWLGWDELPPADEYIAARRKELAVATTRSLYIQPALPLAGEMKNRGPQGLPWTEKYARKLGEAFRDEPYLAGWSLAPTRCPTTGSGGSLPLEARSSARTPSKLSMMNHFGISRILRFEPYLNVVMTDYYPIKPAQHVSRDLRCDREPDAAG